MLNTNFNDSNKKQELVKFIVAQVAAGASNKKYRFEEIIEHDFEDDENIDSYINEHWNNDTSYSYGEYTALVGMGKIKSKYRNKRDIDLPLL